MKQTAYRLRSIRPWLGWIMLAGLLLLGIDPYPFQAHATTIYSYIDEQGNPRFSDSMENIPEKYRAKVKTHEQATPQGHPPSALDSVRASCLSVGHCGIQTEDSGVASWLRHCTSLCFHENSVGAINGPIIGHELFAIADYELCRCGSGCTLAHDVF